MVICMSRFEQHIILKGAVQSVGMRPAILRFALEHHLTGWVCNYAEFVEICWQGGGREKLVEAQDGLLSALPPMAKVGELILGKIEIAEKPYDCFFIKYDREKKGVNVLSLPDLAPCQKCRKELENPLNRRYKFAFNSCSECGVRASVILALPYERSLSSWQDFSLCSECQKEYEDIENRRFHIESTSCPNCSPTLKLYDKNEDILADEYWAIELAAKSIDDGEIVALKGVGGFQLLVDATTSKAVARLRELKRRPTQALAVMFDSSETVKSLTLAMPVELSALSSPQAPLVLLEWQSPYGVSIAPDNPDMVGAMLPSSPLHLLLFKYLKTKMIVATSGNGKSQSPALDLATMQEYNLADKILDHNRKIIWRHDDSIVAEVNHKLHIFRRGRGYGWSLDWLNLAIKEPIVAMGSMYKNSFALANAKLAMLSPYHGDLSSRSGVLAWQKALEMSLNQLSMTPQKVAVDLHPDYYSTIYGEKLAKWFDAKIVRVQHHKAHALAAVAEAMCRRALALVWDGTGLGDDGNIWGAELFGVDMEKATIKRLSTFEPAFLPNGEEAILSPKLQYQARLNGEKNYYNGIWSHSAGRLFDAYAEHIGVAPERISYEGEAAIRLEYHARQELKRGGGWSRLPFVFSDGKVDWQPLWSCDLPQNPALSFHYTLALAAWKMVKYGFENFGHEVVTLSGGVFQNRLLLKFLDDIFKENGVDYFMPQELPVNDGAIAVGQIIYAGLNFRNN